MVSLLIFIFILSALIVVHELGHFLAARKLGVRTEIFSLGFGPVLFKRKRQGTEYKVSLIPLGGFVKLAGDNWQEYQGKQDEFLARPLSERAAIIFWGPLVNYLCGFLCLWFIFFAGYPALTTKVGTVINDLGAEEAGLMPGDKILSINGKAVSFWEELQSVVQGLPLGSKAKLLILRQGHSIEAQVLIKEKQLDGLFGERRKIPLLGITPEGESVTIRHGLFRSFALGLGKTRDWTLITLKGLWMMITGRVSLRESVTGPLGLFYVTSQAARVGFLALLNLVAVLNINLAIFNLLPLPILDGGHLLLLGIEKIRGKAFSPETERIITRVGLTFILTLVLVVTYNDIVRFFGDKLTRFFAR